MTIINNAHAGSQINLLCLIYRVIWRNGGKYTGQEIQRLCAPDNLHTLPDHTKRFPSNLRFWMDEAHQLWREDEQSKLVLTRTATSEMPGDIAIVTNEALFRPQFETIFGNDDHDTEGLFRSLGCLLASDRFSLESPVRINKTTLHEFYSEQIPGFVPNDSERPTVGKYGHFLGLLEIDSKGEYFTDPSRAIRGVLRKVFNDQEELDAGEFLRRLATFLPLLDGGTYRAEVESRMIGPLSADAVTRRLSRSLSLALERLTSAGILAHEGKSDDPNMCVIQGYGTETHASSFRYLAGEAQI